MAFWSPRRPSQQRLFAATWGLYRKRIAFWSHPSTCCVDPSHPARHCLCECAATRVCDEPLHLWTVKPKKPKKKKKIPNFPRDTRFNPNVLNISQAGCCGRRSPATPLPGFGSPPPWVTPASQREGQPSTWEAHPSRGKRARF